MIYAAAGADAADQSYSVTWVNQAVTNATVMQARPLDLSDVRLTGGPLKHAQDLDVDYLLKLEPDRMLYYFYVPGRIEAEGDLEGYGGWDGGGRQLTGHIAGHYLSAVSQMWAATRESGIEEAGGLYR